MDAAADQDVADKALAAAIDEAIKKLKEGIENAIETAAVSASVTLPEDVLGDDTTDTSSAFPGLTGYDTVAEALETWSSELKGKTSVVDVNSHLAALNANYAALANAYVATLKTAADQAAYKENATKRAADALADVEEWLTGGTITWTDGSTVAAHVESAVKAYVTPDAGNWSYYNLTVTGDNTFNVPEGSGTIEATVNVKISAKWSNVWGDPAEKEITVTFSYT